MPFQRLILLRLGPQPVALLGDGGTSVQDIDQLGRILGPPSCLVSLLVIALKWTGFPGPVFYHDILCYQRPKATGLKPWAKQTFMPFNFSGISSQWKKNPHSSLQVFYNLAGIFLTCTFSPSCRFSNRLWISLWSLLIFNIFWWIMG